MNRKAWIAFVIVQLFGEIGPWGASHKVFSWAVSLGCWHHGSDGRLLTRRFQLEGPGDGRSSDRGTA
jgi:hypothetical protein